MDGQGHLERPGEPVDDLGPRPFQHGFGPSHRVVKLIETFPVDRPGHRPPVLGRESAGSGDRVGMSDDGGTVVSVARGGDRWRLRHGDELLAGVG